MSERIDITINAEEVLRALEKVDEKIEETEEKAEIVIEKVEAQTIASYQQVLNMARLGWSITQGVVRAAGGTISATLDAIISGTFAAIAIFQPLLTTAAVTPGMQIQAAIGFANLALTFAALSAAQKKKGEITQTISGFNSILTGLSGFIGMINF